MPLDIKMEIEKLQAQYKEYSSSGSYNALIYGKMGTGKTNLLQTCRAPILIMSFDPGGSKTIRDAIAKGHISVDNKYEIEDPFNPTAFTLWDQQYHFYKREGLFSKIGTLAIDSATTWSSSAMNIVLKKAGRAGSQPFQQDYLPAMVILENAIKDLLSLPCDVILIAHETVDKDEATGRLFIGPDFIGKLKNRILCSSMRSTVPKLKRPQKVWSIVSLPVIMVCILPEQGWALTIASTHMRSRTSRTSSERQDMIRQIKYYKKGA